MDKSLQLTFWASLYVPIITESRPQSSQPLIRRPAMPTPKQRDMETYIIFYDIWLQGQLPVYYFQPETAVNHSAVLTLGQTTTGTSGRWPRDATGSLLFNF